MGRSVGIIKIIFSEFRVGKVKKMILSISYGSRMNPFHLTKLEMSSKVLGIHNFILINAAEYILSSLAKFHSF